MMKDDSVNRPKMYSTMMMIFFQTHSTVIGKVCKNLKLIYEHFKSSLDIVNYINVDICSLSVRL